MTTAATAICLLLGGPTYTINVRGKLLPFEFHPQCGPWPLHKVTGSPLMKEPPGFWDAIERWIVGGKRLDGDQCLLPQWCPKCDATGDEIRHLGGPHYEIVGRCKTCDGKYVLFVEEK